MITTVMKWFPEKGFGFAQANGKQVFIHCSILRPKPRRGEDLTGVEVLLEEVDWKASKGPKAIKACWSTTLKYYVEEDEKKIWEAGRQEILRRLKAGEDLDFEDLVPFIENKVNGEVGEAYNQLAMQSTENYQRGKEVVKRWNDEPVRKMDFKAHRIACTGEPWYADSGLTFVRFVKGGENTVYAIFKKSDGTYGATYGWRIEKDGEIINLRGDDKTANLILHNPDHYRISPKGGYGQDVPEDWNPDASYGDLRLGW